MATAPQLRLQIPKTFADIGQAYSIAVPEAQTRTAWRQGKKVHTGAGGLRTRVSRRLGAKMGKSVRLGQPKNIGLDPTITQYDKAYRKDHRTGEKIWTLDIFEASRRVRPRSMLVIPTEAAARLAGERWRRNVTLSMFKGQLIFLSAEPRRGIRGRRRKEGGGRRGVYVHKNDPKTVLFYVTGPVRLRRLFQPRASVFERQLRNTDDLLAKELDRRLARLIKKV